MKNHKLINFFLGNPKKQVLYTILGFQRNVNSKRDKETLKLHTNATNYLSYFIAYNHHLCKIEYYLINYGYPYALDKTKLPLDIAQRLDSLDDISPSVRTARIDMKCTFLIA